MCSPEFPAQEAVLAGLAAVDPAALDPVTLMGHITALSSFIDRAQRELARLTGALDATGGAGETGYSSTAAFIRNACGKMPGRAGELVAVARGLRNLEASDKALASGEISFDAASAICRAAAQIDDDAAAAAAEAQLLDAATGHGPAGQRLDPARLRQLGQDLAYMADPDRVEEKQRKRFERRYLSFGLTLDDTGTLCGACPDALSLEVIKTAADAFGALDGTTDARTAAQRRMDGLVAACKTALDTGRAGTRHGAVPHLSVLVEERTLAGHDGSPPARTGYGATLTARQVLALACSAELTVIRWTDGRVLDVGRSYRTDTPAIRRALEARDRGCRWPGCGMPAVWCTAHHIRQWRKGGRTSVRTMILLCWVHHMYFVHEYGWMISGDPDGAITFSHPDGLVLESPPSAGTRPRGP